MKDNRCVTDSLERKYGLWFLKNDDTISRKCKCCGIDFDYPATKSSLEQIKKQHMASKLLENFLNLSLDDPNLIGYLNVILEDVVDFIDDTSKSLLDRRFDELLNCSYVTEENKVFIRGFKTSIINNDVDLFLDTKEYFDNYNIESLSYFVDGSKIQIR